MQDIQISKNYSQVSNIYDHIMRKVRYDYWADYIYLLTSNYVDENADVLELAAGNCKLAKFLSAYYQSYVAADLSITMLNKQSSSTFLKVCCDMIHPPFKSKFDLVLSTFDSVNYLLTKKELLTFFSEIKKLLSDKGIFTFDVSLEKNSYKHIKDPVRTGTYRGIQYRQESIYDTEKHIHKNIFYITNLAGKTFEEIHTQRIFPFETYFELANSARLDVLQCFDAFTFDDGKPTSSRVQFVMARRK